MPNYRYIALTEDGENKKGTYYAKDKNEVLNILIQKKYYPIKIIPIFFEINLFKNKFHSKDLSVFCRQLFTMIHAGIPILQSIESILEQIENKKFKDTIKYIIKNLNKGMSFSQSLERQKKFFPEFFIHMIEAGEISGQLEKILKNLSLYYEKETKTKEVIKKAMFYPMILFFLCIFVSFFMVQFVMPTFIEIFKQENIPLPIPTKILLWISHLYMKHKYNFLFLCILWVYIIQRFLHKENGKSIFHHLLLKIPFVKTLIKKIIFYKFARTLGILLSSGIPLMKALEITKNVIRNSDVKKYINTISKNIMSGKSLKEAMMNTSFFPTILISMVNIGEVSGQLDIILDKMADFYDEEIELGVQKMIALFEPCMTIIMAIIIGFISISIVLPLFNMVYTIS
ncbi:type II secretion system F family protein [Inediibacterium massiliense]|uniref:type II secretion system F family protein n=1 Tax=Inediibacterium massiliense TaxID=1658111 RepID=UPI0006B57607|nr:type II secretion system F family protein [Inediibacterium massiliense]